MSGYLDLINDWEVSNPLPPPLPVKYSSDIKLKKPTIPLTISNKESPRIQIKKLDVTLLAKKLVSEIEGQGLSIGWTATQLTDLQKTLPCFIPCKIGLITLRSICIELLHPDGSIRGAVTHYNHLVDQPWLKHTKRRSDNDG